MSRLCAILCLLVCLAAAPPAAAQGLIDPDRLQFLIDSADAGVADTHGTGASATEGAESASPVDAPPEVGPMGGVRGQLRPVRHTVLSAGFAGRVDAFPATVGERVGAGDALVEMDCDELEADRAAMAARVSAAAARYDVNRRLAAANNVSGLEVDLSRAELSVAQAEARRVAAKIAYCTVSAPFAGVVAAKHVQAYEHVQTGEPLLDLVDSSELRVEVAVPSAWLARLRAEHAFVLRVDELAGLAIRGRILRSEGRVDPVSQTVRLIGYLDAHPPGLLAGMSGPVVLDGADMTQ